MSDDDRQGEQHIGDMDLNAMFSRRPRTDAEMAEYHAANARRNGMERWRKSGVQKRHALCIDEGKYREQPEFAKCHGLDDGWAIGLFGVRGTGKTQLAAKLIFDRCMQDRSAKYMRLREFLLALKETWQDGQKLTEHAVMERHEKPSLLVIDEIGERTGGPWDNEVLTDLVDRRYGLMKDTILIGNVEADKLDATIPSVMRRIYQTGGVIQMDTPITMP